MSKYGTNIINTKKSKSIHNNRTFKYILPLIKIYGQEFVNMYSSLHKIANGIGDYTINKLGLDYNKHIFILVDVIESEKRFDKPFDEFIEDFRSHRSYETDYIFDIKSKMHMLVIKIPDEFIKAITHFKNSEYSKMYNTIDIDYFFSNERGKLHKPIFTKDASYKKIFEKKIKEEFILKEVPNEDWKEYDFPIELKNEIFNYQEEE